MEKSRRREADQMLRTFIVNQLEEARLALGNVQAELGQDIIKAIDHAEPLGRIDTRLMGLIGKIDDAPVGYAGFFDAIKVDEEKLAQIYDFDAAMLDDADLITASVAALGKAVRDNGDISSAVRDLDQCRCSSQHGICQSSRPFNPHRVSANLDFELRRNKTTTTVYNRIFL